MTVAVAVKFTGPPEAGEAIIIAADRMITSDWGAPTEHTLSVRKGAGIPKRSYLVAAGSIQVHTALLMDMREYFDANPDLAVETIAEEYAQRFVKYRQKYAELEFLAPIGLTIDKMFDKDVRIPPAESARIIRDIDALDIQFEALIAGIDKRETPAVLTIDSRGHIVPHYDIGYASVGIGRAHANAHLAAIKYTPAAAYYYALWAAFCAKKRGEAAPGVGPETDMTLVTKLGWEPVDYRLVDRMEELYKDRAKAILALDEGSGKSLYEFWGELKEADDKQKAAAQAGAGIDPSAGGGSAPPGGDGSRGDEAPPKEEPGVLPGAIEPKAEG